MVFVLLRLINIWNSLMKKHMEGGSLSRWQGHNGRVGPGGGQESGSSSKFRDPSTLAILWGFSRSVIRQLDQKWGNKVLNLYPYGMPEPQATGLLTTPQLRLQKKCSFNDAFHYFHEDMTYREILSVAVLIGTMKEAQNYYANSHGSWIPITVTL